MAAAQQEQRKIMETNGWGERSGQGSQQAWQGVSRAGLGPRGVGWGLSCQVGMEGSTLNQSK